MRFLKLRVLTGIILRAQSIDDHLREMMLLLGLANSISAATENEIN
jgi:hypothetical protein